MPTGTGVSGVCGKGVWVAAILAAVAITAQNRSAVMRMMPGIDYRCIAAHLIKMAGFSYKAARSCI